MTFRTGPSRDGRMAPGGWLALAIAFAAAAATLLLGYGPEVWRGYRSAGWPRTSGEVLEADLVHYQGPKTGHTHSPYVRYGYTVDGRQLEAERVSFAPAKERGPEAPLLDRVRTAYPVGSRVDVFYDPADPTQACLVPGIHPALLWGLVAVVAATALIAAGCGWRFIRARRAAGSG